jgi:uncharacterized membrane protein YdfJ with MMPL/SSD domain
MVPARQVGVAASLAIAFAVFASLAGIPALLSLMRLPRLDREKHKQVWPWLDRLLAWNTRQVLQRARAVLIGSILMAVLGLGMSALIKVDSNSEKMFNENHPLTQ